MQKTKQLPVRYTPGSVSVATTPKVYYSADIQAAGGVDAFMKSIGADKEKSLPEIDFSEKEWMEMLNEESK